MLFKFFFSKCYQTIILVSKRTSFLFGIRIDEYGIASLALPV
jgi:hypothetical protein